MSLNNIFCDHFQTNHFKQLYDLIYKQHLGTITKNQ